MKVIVTGGSGDIGEYVVADLKRKHSVVVVDKKPPKRNTDVEFCEIDLLDSSATLNVIKGADALIHLAAIPNPRHDQPDEIMRVNMTCAYNVLQAAKENSIPRLIYGGSDSATGFGYHNKVHTPLYLPMDVDHPCWPHECYGFTKYFGELMFREYSRTFRIHTISIRFMWVLLERDSEAVSQIKSGKGEMFDWLGAYVMPQDVAQIISRALEYRINENAPFPFEAFYVHAAKTFLNVPTLEQAKRIWGTVPKLKNPDYYKNNRRAPFFDISDARTKLGYVPDFDVDNFVVRR